MNPVGVALSLIGFAMAGFAAYAWRASLPRHERPSILQMRRLRADYGRYTKLFWAGTALWVIGLVILVVTDESGSV